MDSSLLILGVLQVIFLLLYVWVGRAFINQPGWNLPVIFRNPLVRGVLVTGLLIAIVQDFRQEIENSLLFGHVYDFLAGQLDIIEKWI